MVTVINATGMAIPANTAIDLSPYLEDDIACLISLRTLERAAQVIEFTGVAIAAHTHEVEVVADHTHNVEEEPVHTHVIGISFGEAVSDAGHTHVLTVYPAGAFTPSVDAQGGYTPTVDDGGGDYISVGAAPVVGAIDDTHVVNNSGWLNAADVTPAAGSVALTGRRQIHMGDAIESTTLLELRVLYYKDAAGVF